MAINILQFDPLNSQQDYQFIARRLDTGEDVIGAAVVDKIPQMVGNNNRYYILTPYFNNDSLSSMRFSRFQVDKDSIRPYTQSEEVARLLSQGQDVELVELVYETPSTVHEKTVALLSPYDKVPYGLWAKVSDEVPETITEDIEEVKEEPDKSDETPVVEKTPEPKKRGRKKKNP